MIHQNQSINIHTHSLQPQKTPNAISTLFANPSPDHRIFLILLFKFWIPNLAETDNGTKKLKTILQSSLSSELLSEKVQNRVLIRVLEYTLDVIPNKSEKF
ncbi:hypothetical protein RYX36_021982 [Vicia faba]